MSSNLSTKFSRSRIDGLFGAENSEDVLTLSVQDLEQFENHPFLVKDDDAMKELEASIRSSGIICPVIVRSKGSKYEIISGHRRVHAAKNAGLTEVPAIVRSMDDKEAINIMCISNIYRPEILPSERGKAFQLQLISSDITMEQLAQKLEINRITIHRYTRILQLIEPLLTLVDERKLQVNAASELSYLDQSVQFLINEIYEEAGKLPNINQATILKKEGSNLGKDDIKSIMGLLTLDDKPKLSMKNIKSYFSFENYDFPEERMAEVVYMLLEKWRDETALSIGEKTRDRQEK